MTNEEAIDVLKNDSCYECTYGCFSVADCIAECAYKDAVVMAIEALKYQETVKQLENIYIVPKDRTWVVNGIDIKEILKTQYLKSLERAENRLGHSDD